jgi:hypothetical protein
MEEDRRIRENTDVTGTLKFYQRTTDILSFKRVKMTRTNDKIVPVLTLSTNLQGHTGREADHSHPCNSEVKNTWSSNSTPSYAFMT